MTASTVSASLATASAMSAVQTVYSQYQGYAQAMEYGEADPSAVPLPLAGRVRPWMGLPSVSCFSSSISYRYRPEPELWHVSCINTTRGSRKRILTGCQASSVGPTGEEGWRVGPRHFPV